MASTSGKCPWCSRPPMIGKFCIWCYVRLYARRYKCIQLGWWWKHEKGLVKRLKARYYCIEQGVDPVPTEDEIVRWLRTPLDGYKLEAAKDETAMRRLIAGVDRAARRQHE